MGNIISACCVAREVSFVKIIYWEGNMKILTGKRRFAGEIMNEFPESMVCDSDRFFIGHNIPALAIDDVLKPGKTYFVLPLDIFSSEILSASFISAFVACKHRRAPLNLSESSLEYLKGSNGRVLIKVKSEFLEKHLTYREDLDGDHENEVKSVNACNSFLCSTPELRKEYEYLVRPKDHVWSPNLDTISEAKKIRHQSPYRFIGLDL